MGRRLPPLNAVRAFEAAARHAGFARAAAELNVTPAAISQQIRTLEGWLGVTLFRREPQGVSLTEAGSAYWPDLCEALDRLADATSRVQRLGARRVVRVSTMPSFASRWLIPRLGRFRLIHPDVDVEVVATSALADFVADAVDLAIRYGKGVYPGLRSELLMFEDVFPVCSPALAAGPPALQSPGDLAYVTLLHDLPDEGGLHDLNWAEWLRAVGASTVDAMRGPRFNYTHMSISAALAGQGVALATSALISDDLQTGRLVRPFAERVRAPHAYFLVYPETVAARPRAAAFRDWIIAEAADAGLDAPPVSVA